MISNRSTCMFGVLLSLTLLLGSSNGQASECKQTSAGQEYAGNLNVTKSGKSCVSWASSSYKNGAMYPEGSADAAGARCRNPDPNYEAGPWCYTTEGPGKWEDCNVPLCTQQTMFCKKTDAGTEFIGHLSVTKSGRHCQSWSEQTPQQHPYTKDSLYPDGSVVAAGNRCRNPTPEYKNGPWCYTKDPKVPWEDCDVKLCSADESSYCKDTHKGDTFKGSVSMTRSGKQCQAWSSQSPQQHTFTADSMFVDGKVSAAGNNCRNPGGIMPDGPWCFTTDNQTRWEYCAIDLCPEAKSLCKITQAGREFKGNLTKTVSGRTCQAWSAQSPNSHSYTANSLYPDGSAAAAGNNCRNPDGGFTQGPWCYTTDPLVPWELCDVKFCPKDYITYCKDTDQGREFKGLVSKTKSNKTCQAWSTQSPNTHTFTKDSMFPDGSVAAAGNNCRNPDPNNYLGPWCYVTDGGPNLKMEECDIPLCPNAIPVTKPCKTSQAGREFAGNVAKTKSGYICQSWGAQSPNTHSYTGSAFPEGNATLAGNRCRNPDSTYNEGPWCYTTDSTVRWEICDIPQCSNSTQRFCKDSTSGRDFMGDLTVTKSNKTCQRWDAQTPFAHNFTSNFMFPDGSVTAAGNKCRNPDATFTQGPFCFTTDPNTRYELCDVPFCDKAQPTFCKKTQAGMEFQGHLSVTKSGKTCQAWSSQSPNSHGFTAPNLYPDGSAEAAGNRCRNPDASFKEGPWCYTTDPKTPWEICDVPMCPKDGDFCKKTVEGREFTGALAETKSGKLCQAWSSQSPHKHNFTQDSMFPDGSAAKAGSHCRNPDPNIKDGPWCFTTDPSVRMEACNVALCPADGPSFCKTTKEGRDFMGHLTVTKSGKTCQSWADQSPNPHGFTAPNLYPDGSAAAAGNRCRNPDASFNEGPWCYTTDPKTPWELCDVPMCENKNLTLCKETATGRDFKGDIRTTVNGKTCQRWDLQKPWSHNFTSDFMFPDGSVPAAENKCRNPDPNYKGGPWCFTTDPNSKWEPCNVPLCEESKPAFCKLTQPGREFIGHLSVTKSGKTCQSWTEQKPNTHPYTDGKAYPDGSVAAAGNKCRNPDPGYTKGPWCYTTDPNTPWEDCDVPLCPSVNQTFCKSTKAGRDFTGNLRETKSGRICQSWIEQVPNKHNFTQDSMFPDGSVKLAGNKCRNPDPTFLNGPWCFTYDPAMPREECAVEECPPTPAAYCKETPQGLEFKGHLTVTKSGHKCQSWASQTPNSHSYTQDSMFPDGSAALADNRCRNPDKSYAPGPWCYTLNSTKPWEDCDVPLCSNETFCKETAAGHTFKGDLRKTKSGLICQSWDAQTPNAHNFTNDFMFPDGSVKAAGNRCRNPDPNYKGGPWCFTFDKNTHWEECDVPFCQSSTFCKETQAGREFKGHLTVTKSGKQCQNWTAQYPNTHTFTDGSMYPEKSVELAGNRCRNPDSSFNEGPWCYTTDPKVPWELCDVPMCPDKQSFCKKTQAGREFAGNLKETKSGRMCVSWSSMTPSKHNYTNAMFVDGSLLIADNRCRNPDAKFNEGPWCYTADPKVPWELCDVPMCPDEPASFCKETVAGREFKGHLTVTKSGKLCQSWASQTPNAHSYTNNLDFPDGSPLLADNRCRNPDKTFLHGPWCYTTDPAVPWEICDVPLCHQIRKDLCKNMTSGRDFKGDLRVTKSGKTCQSWSAQKPFAHNFTSDFMFADGSVAAAENKCRNPDPHYTAGPWCFTTDPNVKFEACDVPMCPKERPPFCKETQKGQEFQGHLTVTKSGHKCQKWSEQTPNKHSYTSDSLFPEKNITLAADRCRNPDASFNDGPWCYTTNSSVPWEVCDVPLCPKEDDDFCKQTPAGREFLGDLRETESGRLCQAWSSQTPNKHNFTVDTMYPDKSVLLAENKCRNPDPTFGQGPWCYTTDPAVPWELCKVPQCPAIAPSFCKQTQPGRDFKGHLTVTKSGKPCQSWAAQSPNRHSFTADHLFPDGSALIAGNRCRNPDSSFLEGPWCYTTDPSVPWELCDVPMCANQTFCKETIAGREFKGDLRVTKSGKPCQSWKAQTPHAHNFTAAFMFPDATIDEAGDRCRNPDPAFPNGPWCFTTDPKTRLEECDVPVCQRKLPAFCKETEAGREFIGHLTVTKSGFPCQSWASQSPNPHPYTSNSSFPDKTVEEAGNRCRNPDPNFGTGPWCYTTNPNKRWEECAVEMCPKETETFCKKTKEGWEFQGNLKQSKSGRICQSWSSQTPNAHNFTDDKLFPDGSVLIAGNRCRNPDKTFKDGPWCYTMDPSMPRELCDVPLCPDAAPAFCKKTTAGHEFEGHLTVTKSGKPCQSWAEQTPNKHIYTKDSMYPEKSVKIADNRCRNPDPEFLDGPWCYTTDPSVSWELCDVPDCPKLNKTYCKESDTGRDFRGDLRQTKSGKTCQRWDSQTPHRHNFTSDFMFSDGSLKGAENMCRNPDPNYKGGPWCYTTDPNTMWEPCDVPICNNLNASFCKSTQAGTEFIGHLTVTKSGKPCQAWDQQTPNKHTYTDNKLFPDGSAALAGNRCRNPDPSYGNGPWCYTTDPTVPWEDCNVPFCPKENMTYCKSNEAGRDFVGNLRETKSGKICQSWTSQSPHTHNFTSNSLFPDGSAALAENKCRNPDPNFTKGPWCFTMDPKVPREECDVSLCPVLPTFCKKTIAGREFMGHLTVTRSGKQCQSWAAQTPNKHTYTANELFPDGSAEAAGARCRNPDSSFGEGPWCYTTDPKVPWEICDVQMCPKPEDYYCKKTDDGRDFTGRLSTTKSGRSCQTWASQNKTTYPFIVDANFPGGSVANAGNLCRNPNPAITDGPWCFVNDPNIKWEYCDVPHCEKESPSFCKITKPGREFKGHLAVTKSGKTCQSWASQTPNPHSYTDGSLYPDGSAEAAGNRCRNPDSSFMEGPWCFTTDPNVRWEVCDVPLCNVQNITICKKTDEGREFTGNLRVTQSGYTCQAWSSQAPNTHTFTQDNMFPDGSVALADNRCRNPDPNNKLGPWCYTTDSKVKMEQCAVPLCPKEQGPCKKTQGGQEFKGNVTKTRTGKTCQAWSSQIPNSHGYTANNLYPDGSAAAAGNMCRNPDVSFSEGPWCYTTDPKVPWEVCDIPLCPQESSFCKTTLAGREFKGHLTTTKSGKQCQSWAAQTPNSHPFTSDYLYPDGSVALAADRCRNPDPNFSDGPWCYTTDPNLRWEVCDVPICPDTKVEIPICKNSVAGREFLGNITKTMSGKTCQRWDQQSPNPHGYTADNLYPDGSAAKAGNQCRNPDMYYTDGPWCYTTDPSVPWERCNVPLCEHALGFCKKTQGGFDFVGHLTKTIGGHDCQRWDQQKPNAHGYTQDSMYPDGSVSAAANRCRNPDKGYTKGPWCYTTNPAVPWQDCDVPMC